MLGKLWDKAKEIFSSNDDGFIQKTGGVVAWGTRKLADLVGVLPLGIGNIGSTLLEGVATVADAGSHLITGDLSGAGQAAMEGGSRIMSNLTSIKRWTVGSGIVGTARELFGVGKKDISQYSSRAGWNMFDNPLMKFLGAIGLPTLVGGLGSMLGLGGIAGLMGGGSLLGTLGMVAAVGALAYGGYKLISSLGDKGEEAERANTPEVPGQARDRAVTRERAHELGQERTLDPREVEGVGSPDVTPGMVGGRGTTREVPGT